MSIDTIVILVIVVISIGALVALERHSRKNRSAEKSAGEINPPAEAGE